MKTVLSKLFLDLFSYTMLDLIYSKNIIYSYKKIIYVVSGLAISLVAIEKYNSFQILPALLQFPLLSLSEFSYKITSFRIIRRIFRRLVEFSDFLP